jgi:hypothetical protein
MAQIQTTDPNFSDSELMEELTDEELLEIQGGSFWYDLNRAFNRAFWGRKQVIGVGVTIPIPEWRNNRSQVPDPYEP